MRKKIFKAIAAAIAAVPGIEYVDLWNNQTQVTMSAAVYSAF